MPESDVIKHNYLFCQFVNPERGHEGDRCDCFDTPSQRRTTLAKQRLARLQANRSINRASTSNDPESAVASDPAVTKESNLERWLQFIIDNPTLCNLFRDHLRDSFCEENCYALCRVQLID